MDIKQILNDKGEIDGGHLNHQWAWYAGNLKGFFTELSEIINAHIATLNQSTPITPELLKRAGFVGGRKEHFARSYETGEFSINGNWYEGIKTMEQLATIWECYTGEPLNWRHDPAAEVRKRLESMGIVWNGFSGHAGERKELYITLLHNREGGWSYQLIYDTPDNTQMLCVGGLLKNSLGASLETAQKLTEEEVFLCKREDKGE